MTDITEKDIQQAINLIKYKKEYYSNYYKKEENKVKRNKRANEYLKRIKEDPEKREKILARYREYYLQVIKPKNDLRNKEKKDNLLKIKSDIEELKKQRKQVKIQ